MRVNDEPERLRLDVDEPYIAIEIPANWAQMQRDDLSDALRWREATDRVFAHYIGIEDGKYVITGAAVEGERRFLVAQRAGAVLWDRLAL